MTNPHNFGQQSPYGQGQPSADPYAPQQGWQQGQPSADPYAPQQGQQGWQSQPSAAPYAQPQQSWQSQPSADPYGQPSADPYGQGQQGWQQPQQGWQQPQQGWQQPGAMVPAMHGMPPMRPRMEIGQAFSAFWKNFAVFDGRAGKGEFWWTVLVNLLISVPLSFVGVGFIYSLASLIPSIAVGIRRMHDTNRSGWYVLVPIMNIVWAIEDSNPAGARFDAPDGSQPAV